MFSLFHSKKAQGMSMNVIIVAVIAIVILVVLILIFTGKTKFFSKTTGDCSTKGGQCLSAPCPDGYITHSGGNCQSQQVCCQKFDAAS